MSDEVAKRIHNVLGGRDVVDKTTRPPHEVTVDHKLPMIRWNEASSKEQTNYNELTDEQISDRFQLLKE